MVFRQTVILVCMCAPFLGTEEVSGYRGKDRKRPYEREKWGLLGVLWWGRGPKRLRSNNQKTGRIETLSIRNEHSDRTLDNIWQK